MNDNNDLRKGAGEIVALKRKGDFDERPHLLAVAKSLRRTLLKLPKPARYYASNIIEQIKEATKSSRDAERMRPLIAVQERLLRRALQ